MKEYKIKIISKNINFDPKKIFKIISDFIFNLISGPNEIEPIIEKIFDKYAKINDSNYIVIKDSFKLEIFIEPYEKEHSTMSKLFALYIRHLKGEDVITKIIHADDMDNEVEEDIINGFHISDFLSVIIQSPVFEIFKHNNEIIITNEKYFLYNYSLFNIIPQNQNEFVLKFLNKPMVKYIFIKK